MKNKAFVFDFILIAIVFVIFSCSQNNSIKLINIIPQPVNLEINNGVFSLDNKTGIILVSLDESLARAVEIFTEEFNSSYGFEMEIQNGVHDKTRDGNIFLDLSGRVEELGEEGYELSVDRKNINIVSAKPAGAYYGLQTLLQLCPLLNKNKEVNNKILEIPCVKIFDKPRFSWRGDMLDVSRHFLPLDFIKKNINYLARYKMNTFHWHLTDDQGWRIEIKKYPKLTKTGAWRVDHNEEPWWGRDPQKPGEEATYGGFYTQEEIKEIINYAKDRFITIVPEIDMPGHSRSAIASYPEISCDGGPYTVATGGIASENTYCPGKEITFKFIEAVLDEVLSLFPGEYFHIGGDECNKSTWENCPDCQSRIRNEGLKNENELQSYFIKRIEKLVNERGKKLIGWDEILEGGLAPNASVMSWRGESGGIEAARMGHYVVMTPTTYCYLDLKQGDPELEPPLGYSQNRLSTTYSYNPVPAELTEEESAYILGTQGNLWGESIQDEDDANYMLFPRLFAIAEVGWTPLEMKNWDNFIIRLEHHLEILKGNGIKYAPSMYNVDFVVVPDSVTGVLKMGFSTEHGKVQIRYTFDETDPIISSDIFSEPFFLDKTTTIKAAAFSEGERKGRITKKTIYIHKGAGKKVSFDILWSEKYPGGRELGLTDCLRGGISYMDKNWMGFEGKDLVVKIDLGELKEVSKIILSCLESQRQWIFLPAKVKVEVSENDIDYVSKIHKTGEIINQPEPAIRELVLEFPGEKVRYVRLSAENIKTCPTWHRGAGGNSWIFIDEIIIE